MNLGTSTAKALAWSTVAAAALAGLHILGPPVAPPPWTEPSTLVAWFESVGPERATMSVIRLVALGLGWYMLAATFLAATVRLLSLPARVVSVVDGIAVPVVRRLVVGVGVAATLSSGAAAAAPHNDGPDTEIELLRRLPDKPPAPVPRPVAPAPLPAGASAPPSPRLWTVAAGDHLWAIAERVLAEALARPPTDAEVDPYWRALIAVNRLRLRDPANPDLIFPGQVFLVPPPPNG